MGATLAEETDGAGNTLVRYACATSGAALAQQSYRIANGATDPTDTEGRWRWLLLTPTPTWPPWWATTGPWPSRRPWSATSFRTMPPLHPARRIPRTPVRHPQQAGGRRLGCLCQHVSLRGKGESRPYSLPGGSSTLDPGPPTYFVC